MTFTVPTSIPTTNTPSSAVLFPQVTPRAVASTTAIPVDDFISTKHIIIPGVTNSHVTLAPHTIEIAIPTCVQTITPDKNGYVPPGTCNALWNYYPKFAAALIFAILFGALTMVHVWQASAYKKVRPPSSVSIPRSPTDSVLEVLLGSYNGRLLGDGCLYLPHH